jgi:predicted MFS family arabinose efflux permease
MHTTSQPDPGRAKWVAWGLAASCYVLAMFHRMSLGVASLDAGARLHVGSGAVAALSVAGLGAYLLGQVPAGLVSDRIGPRRALAGGLLLMAAGEAIFATSSAFAPALAGRALIGLGDACIFLNVLRVAAHWFPRAQFAPLTAATAALGAVGQLATTVPLNRALHGAGWTATFLAGAVLTGVLAVVVGTLLREHPPGAAVARRHDHPPIRASLARAWRRPATRDGFWLHFTTMAPFVVVTGLWGAPILVDAQGMSRGHASAVLLIAVATTAIAAPVIGVLARRHPDARLPLALTTSGAVLAALTALTFVPAHAIPPLVSVVCVSVLGVGCATSMLAFDVARREGDHHDGASTSALVNLGGFSAAIAGDIGVAAGRSALGVGSGAALLPLLLIAAFGFWRLAVRVRAQTATMPGHVAWAQ